MATNNRNQNMMTISEACALGMARKAAQSPTIDSINAQYAKFKAQHPDCVLLFEIGEFYELLHDDARRVSKALGLTLTTKRETIPMCGIPRDQLEQYLRKLIDAGMRAAVLSDASRPRGSFD